jgi:hypothetical protein
LVKSVTACWIRLCTRWSAGTLGEVVLGDVVVGVVVGTVTDVPANTLAMAPDSEVDMATMSLLPPTLLYTAITYCNSGTAFRDAFTYNGRKYSIDWPTGTMSTFPSSTLDPSRLSSDIS